MAKIDKAKNASLKGKGKLKEVVGKVTRNDDLREEGEDDQTVANLKQAGEKIKDAFKK